LDELDVRIVRSLLRSDLSAPFSLVHRPSLREVARALRVDEVTVRNRYKRLQVRGFLSGWKLLPNPLLFGYRMMNILVDTRPKTSKAEMITKLRHVDGVFHLIDYHGNSLGVNTFYDSDQSLSRTLQLISKITNAVDLIQIHWNTPPIDTHNLTETDWAIIHNMENDALKPHVQVAKELRLTERTVRNRLKRLEEMHLLIVLPTFDISSIDRMIGMALIYVYASRDVKTVVDQAILSHFDGIYLWARLTDQDRGYIILVAASMSSLSPFLEWTEKLPGVASARIEIFLQTIELYEEAGKLFHRQTSP
jgi:DNA-binding Lrp family transcriptional regulator